MKDKATGVMLSKFSLNITFRKGITIEIENTLKMALRIVNSINWATLTLYGLVKPNMCLNLIKAAKINGGNYFWGKKKFPAIIPVLNSSNRLPPLEYL